ncbi:MAG TPA: tandem-95 repeat protein, partial [Chryseolinea sp.]|nr:tandem-95 repeat protein [Chryseolinea sp.]
PNQPPSITGQVALTTVEQTPITLKLADLIASDPDNDPLTLIVVPGTGYAVSNTTTVTPNAGIIGNLTVTVRVNDGKVDSAPFGLVINVTKKPNVAPLITAQVPLSTNVNTPITIQVNNLSITDPDNSYPGDFTLILSGGADYTVVNSTVTPNAGFVGKLTIPTKVSDGQAQSPSFDLEVNVTPKPNVVPIITSQDALSTFISTAITLKVENLRITDPDNTYPGDFTLILHNGANYTFNGTTVTPNLLFVGDLTVPVTVRDAASESASFPLKIQVTLLPNVAPIITGQDPLKTFVATPITIDLNNIKVTDPDNKYPEDFSLLLYNGPNYIFNNATVTPAAGFIGKLSVPVTVNDGKATSNKANLEIVVEEPVDEAPVITGQNDVKVDEDQSLTLTPAMLKITDPDSKDFTLKIFPPPTNAKYTVNGTVITPALNFNGDLSVNVSVSDGKNESVPFDMKITVTPVNDAPAIIAQTPLSTLVETAININVNNVTISDPDDGNAFTIRVNPPLTGAPYSVSGNSITPLPGITGEISVSVSVNDGTVNSAPYFLRINVTNAPNVPPRIVSQNPDPLKATQNAPKEILVTNLTIEDPDNKTGFKLTVKPGPNYTVAGTTTIIPSNNFVGDLKVPVYVSDGTANSPDFTVNVNVSPPSVKPQIIGQKSVTTAEDTPVTITLTDLIVTDADDTYPNGFTLTVLNGTGYIYSGNTVTPAKDLNGFLIVNVKVKDNDDKESDPYAMAVLVSPVDDAPVISPFETNEISYEPGTDPTPITSILELQDVDNDHLSFAEIGIAHGQYQKNYDELLFTNIGNIRGVFDLDSGKLSLIGYATLLEYQEAIRSVHFNFVLTTTEGVPQVDPKNKTISITVHDGQMFSSNVTRKIIMDTDVKLNIPSAFSPNDDRVNETWQVVALSNADQCEKAVVRVYDKRGVLLFHSVGIEKQWDGKYNGELLPVDTYFYTVDLNLSYSQKTYRGSVSLIR